MVAALFQNFGGFFLEHLAFEARTGVQRRGFQNHGEHRDRGSWRIESL